MPPTSSPLLSAAIIVRDEAEHLEACLSSIGAICDEIVVVDTGSVDESREIARSHGVVMATREWDGDFAAARNTALDLASGQWILYIDADERLDPVDPGIVRAELVDNSDAVSLLVRFRSRPHFSQYREYRLWQHRPDIRFQSRIHETILPDIKSLAADGWPIRFSETVALTHWGYEGDQTAKHRRNQPLLEAQVLDTPGRCYLWNHLGDIRSELGDSSGALEAWGKAIALIRERGLVDRTDMLSYAGYCLHLIGLGHDVASFVDEIIEIAPWYRTVDWIAAANHRQQQRHAAAVPHLKTLIATGIDPADDHVLSYNNEMFTHWAWHALAESLMELDDIAGAAAVYEDARAAYPDNVEYRTKAAALSARAMRS